MLYRKNLTTSLVLTIVWMGMKCTVLNTESTTIMTASNSMYSGSSTTKSMLIISHYVFGTGRGCSLPIGRCQVSLVIRE